jgi:hypothetical protein
LNPIDPRALKRFDEKRHARIAGRNHRQFDCVHLPVLVCEWVEFLERNPRSRIEPPTLLKEGSDAAIPVSSVEPPRKLHRRLECPCGGGVSGLHRHHRCGIISAVRNRPPQLAASLCAIRYFHNFVCKKPLRTRWSIFDRVRSQNPQLHESLYIVLC